MALCRVDGSSELERSLQTKVHDLYGMSAALEMHEGFARKAKQVLSVLAEVDGEVVADEYRRRFSDLMREYEHLDLPKRIYRDADRAYLERVRALSRDLLAYVERYHPIDVEFVPTRAVRSRV